MSDKKSNYKVESQYFPHKFLWKVCNMMFEEGNKNNIKDEKEKFYMTSLLMAFLSYEGYINYLGENIAPEIWEDEQNFFTRQNNYPGIKGKLKFLLEKIGEEMPDEEEVQYSTILKLKKFRDTLSHIKPYKCEISANDDIDEKLFYFQTNLQQYIEQFCTKDNTECVIINVENFIECLHKKAKNYINSKNGCHIKVNGWFHGYALKGFNSINVGRTTSED